MSDTPTPPTEPTTPPPPPDNGKTWAETLHEQSYGHDYDNDKNIQVDGTISAPDKTAGSFPNA